jgi:hypothetical protein
MVDTISPHLQCRCDDVHPLSLHATDECGNASPYTVTTVNDDVAPTGIKPVDMITCAAYKASPTPPTATDNCPDNTAMVMADSDITTPTNAGVMISTPALSLSYRY